MRSGSTPSNFVGLGTSPTTAALRRRFRQVGQPGKASIGTQEPRPRMASKRQEADHVTDLGFCGRSTPLNNLWPLDCRDQPARLRRLIAGTTYYKVRYRKSPHRGRIRNRYESRGKMV